MGQIIKSLASFCLSVCLSGSGCPSFCLSLSYGRNFCSVLMKFCTVVWDPKSKNIFIRGSKSDDPFPYFAPIFHPRNVFSTERAEHLSNEARGPTMPVKSSNEAATCTFCPKTQKWGQCISNGNVWLSVWHNISAIMRDRVMVSKDHIGTIRCASTGHVTDDVTWPQKVNAMTPKSLSHHILTTVEGCLK